MRYALSLFTVALMSAIPTSLDAATLRVPEHHESIQAAIDAAQAGDVVLVAPGTYQEQLRMKLGVTVKSAGDDARGKLGLARAEATVIEGPGKSAEQPGVAMAEGSTLDGFTVTGVGVYDDEAWQKHHATQGEEQSHEHIGKPGVAGIAVVGVSCTVVNNIVHHIGYSGIAILGVKAKDCSPRVLRNICYRNMGGGIGSMRGSTAVIEKNTCFENFYAGIGHDNASPLVVGNTCYDNIRAGIGISEGARPIVRGNKCYHNRRAGIGIRTGAETQPIVEHNECYENDMAGIGNRDQARPIIRHNRCYKNKMAGIGSRDGARALIEHNECYENEMAGIAARLGASPVIRENRCYRNKMAGIGAREKAMPVIEDNECFENQMAGIGSRTDSAPVIRGNRCYRNQMAGIGSRTGARPVIVDNDCFENKMAGIGSRTGAAPVIRSNRCYNNQLAGIGTEQRARAVIVDNESRENQAAGIGVRQDALAVIVGNRCLENRLVAIGLPDGATALIHGNELRRTGGGAPPLVAVKGGSSALFSGNSVRGGGVAGLLVQGTARIVDNRFSSINPKQGSAVWVWKDSSVVAANNQFDGYRNALNAAGSAVTATGNTTRGFQGASIIVKKPSQAARVYDNTAVSGNPKDQAVSIEGAGGENGNVLKKPGQVEPSVDKQFAAWPLLSQRLPGESYHPDFLSDRKRTVQDGPWKLVVTYGKTPQYALFNVANDPQETTNLAERLEQIAFRLRGLLERKAEE